MNDPVIDALIRLGDKAGSMRDMKENPVVDVMANRKLAQSMGNYGGYPVRQPYDSELMYFEKNPHVAGMAAEDRAIIFNPYSEGVNQDAVGMNEASRLWMEENDITPDFEVTDAQREYFKGTPYENDDINMRRTIVGRIISGDPSAQDFTPEQIQFSDSIRKQLHGRVSDGVRQ